MHDCHLTNHLACPLLTAPHPPLQSCVYLGHSNCVVQYYLPSTINVVIPGVSTQAEIQPLLDAFASEVRLVAPHDALAPFWLGNRENLLLLLPLLPLVPC